MFHFCRNPSGAQIPDKTTIIGSIQRIILRRATRSSPTRQKERRASVEPFVTNSTTVQSSWSTCRNNIPTLGLSFQLMRTFWSAFASQGHKEFSRVFHSSLAPLLPKIITDKCLFRSQHLAMCPSMLFHKQTRWRGLLKNTPSTVWTGRFESLRTTPTTFSLLAPSQERWCSTEFRRTRVSWQQESQVSHDSDTLLNHR